MQTLTITSGYMAWFWCDNEHERRWLRVELDRLADGVVRPRGLYLFQCEKYDDLAALRERYRGRSDAGIEVVVYEEAPVPN